MSDSTQQNPVIIEHIWPEIDGGQHAVKRELGDLVTVYADIFKDGHDVLAAVIRYSRPGETSWREVSMQPIGNDRWSGSFVLEKIGTWRFTVEARVEVFDSWRRDTQRKRDAGQDISSDLLEGRALFMASLPNAQAADRARMQTLAGEMEGDGAEALAVVLLGEEAAGLMQRCPERACASRAPQEWLVICDRVRARLGAWYEMFPRSQGTDPTRSATFRECEARLPEIQRMGFDVIYLPPIHPIGHTKRKGPNNSLVAGPDDPGSPYAIGSEAGGHDAVEPSLGTLEDFDHFVHAVHEHGMEVALDFAINCSPDHPYVRQHPEWFFHRPDGTIKYAENPPKRYEDIYPLNFYCEQRAALWEEMRRILVFWIHHGVRIFRVDNPHTKPMPFWAWVLGRIREEYPDVIFLAEAFTRPKVMKYLAKIGYSQSYTYFTWRNSKHELTEYMTELAHTESREFFRPNFFTNTPDILPEILQRGGRPAFQMRFVLAATLAPAYGMYNGFELCENRAIPGTEEYLDSEKYQFKVWDWDRPGNIKGLIALVNQIRREHPALHRLGTIRFLRADNDNMLLYAKTTHDYSDILVVAVNVNPFETHEGPIEFPLDEWGIPEDQNFEVRDLLNDYRSLWRGRNHYLRIDPYLMPAMILHIRRFSHRENEFDYYV